MPKYTVDSVEYGTVVITTKKPSTVWKLKQDLQVDHGWYDDTGLSGFVLCILEGDRKVFTPTKLLTDAHLVAKRLDAMISLEVDGRVAGLQLFPRRAFQVPLGIDHVVFMDTNVIIDIITKRAPVSDLLQQSTTLRVVTATPAREAGRKVEARDLAQFPLVVTPGAAYSRIEPVFLDFYTVNMEGRPRAFKYPHLPEYYPPVDEFAADYRPLFDSDKNDVEAYMEALLGARQMCSDNPGRALSFSFHTRDNLLKGILRDAVSTDDGRRPLLGFVAAEDVARVRIF